MYDDAARNPQDEPHLRRRTHVISRPDQLLAEMPALLQFIPAAPSLVIFGESQGLGPDSTPIVRMDIPTSLVLADHLAEQLGPLSRELRELVDGDAEIEDGLEQVGEKASSALQRVAQLEVEFASHVAGIADSQQLKSAICVLLLRGGCEAGSPAWHGADRFAERLADLFAETGTAMSTVLVAEEIAANSAWRFAGSSSLYAQDDPRATDLAVRNVMSGRQILPSRDEIGRLFERSNGAEICAEAAAAGQDFDPVDAVVRLSALARDVVGESYCHTTLQQAATIVCMPLVFERMLENLLDARGDLEQQEDDDLCATVGEPESPTGQTRPFGSCLHDLELLLQLARLGDDQVRGAALTILGIAYYLRGNGIHTVECLERAVPCGFMPYFGSLVLAFIRNGEPPHVVEGIFRELLDESERMSA